MRDRTMTPAPTREEGQTTTRAPELQGFSEENQRGLVHARLLKKVGVGGGQNPVEDTTKAFLAYWQ